MTFGSSETGARPERGHPAFSLMTHRGTKKPGAPLGGWGDKAKGFERSWSQMLLQQPRLGEGGFHGQLADRHSFCCDQMDTS